MREKIKKYNIPAWYLVTLIFTGVLLGLHFKRKLLMQPTS